MFFLLYFCNFSFAWKLHLKKTHTNKFDMHRSPDTLKTCTKCTTSDFFESVEGLVDKVKKLEGEFLR